eukprot:COSAG06_NODE_89_length_24874_cov_50.509344_25_plen_46_part_00
MIDTLAEATACVFLRTSGAMAGHVRTHVNVQRSLLLRTALHDAVM